VDDKPSQTTERKNAHGDENTETRAKRPDACGPGPVLGGKEGGAFNHEAKAFFE
jgi:hypothetical protein